MPSSGMLCYVALLMAIGVPSSTILVTLMMKALHSSEISVLTA
jgi:hypothetical protein